jgi:type I restriction enzyme M protein
MARGRKGKAAGGNGANLGFEAKLWEMADALRGNMDASEDKHVVLGPIILKYISDTLLLKLLSGEIRAGEAVVGRST